MSFLSVLKSIGHGFQVGVADVSQFSPIISAIPGFGPIATTVLGAITAVEQLIPQSGSGAAKKAVVTTITNTAAPGVEPSTLSTVIDEIVAALNALEAAFAKLPSPTTPAAAVAK